MTDAIDPKSLEAACAVVDDRLETGYGCEFLNLTETMTAAIAAYLAAEREAGRVMVPVEAFQKRRDIYRAKQNRSDPFAEESLTRWDNFRSMAEAIEWLADELDIELSDYDDCAAAAPAA